MKIEFRDLTADEIEIRVGQTIKSDNFEGCSLLLYKNARVDMDLLDEVVGANNWQRHHTRDNANCIVSIYDEDKKEWVSKEDTGTESNTEAEKGLASSSFKRACTNWGIGRSLYTAPKTFVRCALQEKKGSYVPAKGIGWYVKEIGYTANHKISRLVIMETKYDKDTNIVFDWSLNKVIPPKKEKPKPTAPPKPQAVSKAKRIQELIKGTEVTAEQIREYNETNFGKGVKTNDLTDEQFNKLYTAISKFINGEE